MRHLRVVFFLLLPVLNTIIFSAAQSLEEPGPQEEYIPPRTVAVITFQTVPENVKENQWLGTGISEDLSDRLEAAEFESLSVYERRDSTKISRKVGGAQGSISPQNATQIMALKQDIKTKGVDYLVIGSIQSPGKWDNPESDFTMNANIVSVKEEADRGEVADAISVTGKFGAGGAGLFAAQAELSMRVFEALGIDSADFKGTPLSLGQTSNIQAFKSYSEAMIAFDSGDYENAKRLFFKAYQTTGGSYHSALLMFEKSDEKRIEAIESQGAKGTEIASEIEAGDKLLEELEDKQEAHLSTIKYVRAQRAVWKQERYFASGDKHKANEQGEKALAFLAQFRALNSNKALIWKQHIAPNFSYHKDDRLIKLDETVVALQIDDGDISVIRAFNENTGDIQWEYSLCEACYTSESVPVQSGEILFFQYEDANIETVFVVALHMETGQEAWKIQIEHGIYNQPVLHGNMLFVFGSPYYSYGEPDNNIYALDISTGEQIWDYQISNQELYELRVSDDYVYLYCYKSIVALEETTGLKAGEWPATYLPDLKEGIAYFDLNGTLLAREEETLQALWKFDSGNEHLGPCVVSNHTVYTYSESVLYAIDADNGELKWEFETGNPISGIPQIADGVIYVVAESLLYTLDEKDGTSVWKFETELEINYYEEFTGGLVISDDTVYLIASLMFGEQGNLYALERKTGKELWCAEHDQGIFRIILLPEHIVYPANDILFARDASTGELLWTFEAEAMIWPPSLVISDSERQITAIVGEHDIYAIGLNQGGASISDTEADFLSARVYALLGDKERARKIMQQLLSRKPNLRQVALALMNLCADTNSMPCVANTCANYHLRFSSDMHSDEVMQNWISNTPLAWVHPGEMFALEDGSLFGVQDNRIFRLNASSGKEVWSYDIEQKLYDIPSIHHDRIFFQENIETGTYEYEITGAYVLDKNTGHVSMQSKSNAEPEVEPVFDSGVQYIVNDLTLYAIDIKTGGIIWKFVLETSIEFEPVVYQNSIIIDTGFHFYCLDKITGKQKWRYEAMTLHGQLAPLIIEDTALFFKEEIVFAFDIETGVLRWQYTAEDSFISHPATFENIILINNNYEITSLDINTGEIIWQNEADYDRLANTPVVQNGIIFLLAETYVYDEETDSSDDEWAVSAIELSTGKTLWQTHKPGEISHNNDSLLVSQEHIFIMTRDFEYNIGYIFALSAKSGEILWEYDTGYYDYWMPVVDNEMLYVSGVEFMSVIDIQDGRKIWGFEIGKSVPSKPVVSGNLVFMDLSFADRPHSIIALDMTKARQMLQQGKKWWDDEQSGLDD